MVGKSGFIKEPGSGFSSSGEVVGKFGFIKEPGSGVFAGGGDNIAIVAADVESPCGNSWGIKAIGSIMIFFADFSPLPF